LTGANRCRSFAELRSAIVEARAIAVGEAERERGAAAVERWLLAEMERERATKAAAGDKRMTYILSLRAPGSQFQGSSFAESSRRLTISHHGLGRMLTARKTTSGFGRTRANAIIPFRALKRMGPTASLDRSDFTVRSDRPKSQAAASQAVC
jgi:hypothetical protein